MTKSNEIPQDLSLHETLLYLAHDWKANQNKCGHECGAILEKELARFPSESLLSSRVYELEKAIRGLLDAFKDETSLPYDGPKPKAMREGRRVLGLKI